ncbi:MAG: transcriptional repressor [Candidatus Woesearchaeota archaeon]|nr:transcriptional repressor [Candidatus Woesearchaeota archaeon]
MARTSRNTKQKALLQQELESTTTFFTAEELHARVQDKGIGLATVYRYLAACRKQGRLHPYSCGDRTIYSLQQQSHCHFTCEKTGKVMHFAVKNLDFLEGKIPGKVTSFQIEVRGICQDECEPCEGRPE